MKFVLPAILLALFFLPISIPAATTPAQVPQSWVKRLEDGGFLINNKPIVITFCKQPLLLVIPMPESNTIAVYDGPPMKKKARKILRGQYLIFNVAPILGIDCNAPQEPQKPKSKKFFRVISE